MFLPGKTLNEKGAFKGAFTAGIKVLYEKVGFAFDITKRSLQLLN